MLFRISYAIITLIMQQGGELLKISWIELNYKRAGAVPRPETMDYQLVFFRSPVTFRINGREEHYDNNIAILYTDGNKQNYRSRNGEPVKCDIVSFRPSASDKQYIGAKIPFDEPIKVGSPVMIADILKNMKLRLQMVSEYNDEFMTLSMRMIFICLCETETPASDSTGRHDLRHMKLIKLREDIYDNPLEDWSAEKICSSLKISHTYFHRIYYAAFNVTCRQDVIEARLKMAADMLADTDMSIGAVAVSCGYESESYFMRQFKQHKGVTPTEYRLMCQKKTEEEKDEKKG